MQEFTAVGQLPPPTPANIIFQMFYGKQVPMQKPKGFYSLKRCLKQTPTCEMDSSLGDFTDKGSIDVPQMPGAEFVRLSALQCHSHNRLCCLAVCTSSHLLEK